MEPIKRNLLMSDDDVERIKSWLGSARDFYAGVTLFSEITLRYYPYDVIFQNLYRVFSKGGPDSPRNPDTLVYEMERFLKRQHDELHPRRNKQSLYRPGEKDPKEMPPSLQQQMDKLKIENGRLLSELERSKEKIHQLQFLRPE